MTALGAGTPTRDAFASKLNARFPKYWDRDDDAFAQDWAREDLLWINPPFEHFAKVVTKLATDEARAIVVVPEWKHLKWWKALNLLCKSKYRIPRSRKIFRNEEGKLFRQRKWDTWAFLVDGSLDFENYREDELPTMAEIPYFNIESLNSDGKSGVLHRSTDHPVVREITRNLRTSNRSIRPGPSIRSLIKTSDDDPRDSKQEKLLQDIICRFKATSLSEKLSKDPPVRGNHGLADIMLTLNAKPRIQRPFKLVGEREAAIAELIEEFIA